MWFLQYHQCARRRDDHRAQRVLDVRRLHGGLYQWFFFRGDGRTHTRHAQQTCRGPAGVRDQIPADGLRRLLRRDLGDRDGGHEADLRDHREAALSVCFPPSRRKKPLSLSLRSSSLAGAEASGKTTLTLQLIAEAQKVGGTCAFIDAEHALDPLYAQALGVQTDDLLVSQPDTGEQALEICDMLVRSGGVDVVIVDSVAALTPKAEIEGEMGDTHVGLQARLMSQALRKMTGNIKQSNTLVVFINQIRMKIGVMFGSPETTTGGNALKFYSSVRLDIRRIGAVKEADEVVGNETRVKVVKNKVAPPFRQTEFQIMYGAGIHRTAEILDLGVQQGIVEKSGAWYAYKADRIGQGRKNAADFLDDNIEMRAEIESEIRKQLLPQLDNEDVDVVIPDPAQDGLSN